jgi:hypothetical protein
MRENSADPVWFTVMMNDIICDLRENFMFVFNTGGD